MDQTSLTGLYDIKLQWTPDPLAGAPPVEPNGPSIFAAIQEQLGLRFPAEVPVEVFVIDSVQKPSAN